MSVRSRSNWNLKVLVLKERGKPEYPEKNLSEQGREPTTNSTHIWRRRQDTNPGHIGGRQALSPLRHPCSPGSMKFYCLKALIALEQVNTLEVGKKMKSLGVPPCSQKQVAPKYRDVRFNVTDSPPPPSHQESWSIAILLMFVKLYQPYND